VERHYRNLSVLGFVHRFLELLEGALWFAVKGLGHKERIILPGSIGS